MLVTSKEIYKAARKGKFAIPATNFVDLASMKWYVEVAEKLNLPLILALAEAHIGEMISVEDAAYMGQKYAKEAKVPVVLHLDHGATPAIIKKAVDCGFTSVMIDASMDDFETNVKRTREIIDYAHAKNVVVEAEIGHVGAGVNYENQEENDSVYTRVKDAVRFVEETKVDSLAISIGTAHGMYKGIPEINFKRLTDIAGAVETPLVLHGGSSSGDDNLKKCALNGISKINIFTDLVAAAEKEIAKKKATTYFDIRAAAKAGMQGCLEHYYSVFETKPV